MNTLKPAALTFFLLWTTSSIAQAAETLIHYRVNSGDSTAAIPNLGTLGNGTPGGGGVTYSFDTPFVGVPDGGGNNSIVCDGAGGVLAPGTQQLLNSTILANGGFTFETWFKWNGSGDFNAIIDYAGTEKLFRSATGGLLMQTNNVVDHSFGAVPQNEWRHIAAVFSNVSAAAGTHITGDYTFFLNGGPFLSVSGVTINDFGDSLNRTIGVGTHPITGFTNNFFNGFIYEPKVTLGPLSAGELFFDSTVTTLTDEDDGFMGGGDGISLREVIKYGAPGGTITFEPFLAGGAVFLDETLGQLTIAHDLNIDASNLFRPIAISGQENSRIFLINPSQTVTMNHLEIVNGNGGTENGGGIWVSQSANLTLTDCTVRLCEAPCGGAITNGGSLTMIRCALFDNTAGTGGAICNGSSTTMEQCTLANNHSTGAAGAIAHFGGDLSLTHCTISNNSAANGSGGVGKFGGNLTMGHSIIAGNSAPSAPDLSGAITTDQGSNVVGGDPLLSPLGDYGGKTQTMLPLAFSPAVNPANSSGFTTDQRGFARDFSPDSGAVERPPVINVSNTNDNGSGSLRAAVATAGAQGATILIDFALAGQTITLTSGEISIAGREGLIIDGSRTAPGLPITVSGNDATRIFNVGFGSSAVLRDLIISDGFSAQGGGIYNGGHLELIDCTVKNNLTPDGNFFAGGSGGGLYNDVGQVLQLTRCTVSGNATGEGVPGEGSDNGGFGAGIYNLGSLLLDRCTVTGNVCASGGWGGGIFSTEAFVLATSSTITGNSASRGGAIFADNSTVRIRHSIVSFNTAPISSNIAGSFSQDGTNNITDDDPVLAPLGSYGGRTETMPPIAGSPAIDQAVGARHISDQRGIAVDGIPDLGATEYQDPALTTITWSDPATITFGTELTAIQLNATANSPGTITYSPNFGTILDAGTRTLTATFTPDDANFYTSASRDVTITVEKATPVISWAAPNPITYGTALSGSQLNATASNGAAVTYSAASGQVLSAGSISLTASLPATPNFNAASQSVTLTVNKAPLIITADDKARDVNQPNPPLTTTYNGFVNGETAIDVAPTLTTAATISSPPGTYSIEISGGSDPNYTISYVPGKIIVFGLPVSVSGVIWEDLDEDGIRSASDPGIEGAQIFIFDAAGQQLIAITTTAADGSYGLGEADGLTPGANTFALTLPADRISRETLWIATLRDQGSDESADSDLEPCDLVAGVCLTQSLEIPDGPLQWDGGLVNQGFNRGTVEGQLWNDDNQDSSSVGERGFGNGTVHLLTAAGDRLRTTQTDLNGDYRFLNVLPGSYRVRFERPIGIDRFSNQTGESAVLPASGISDAVTLDLGGTASVSAGIHDESPLALIAQIGVLRRADETVQGLRLHRDSQTGATSLRFTVLPLLRTADGTFFFPAQHFETSTDLQTWRPLDVTIPASTQAAPREERIAVESGQGPTFFRVRVESPQS